jgi:hypothetical protein
MFSFIFEATKKSLSNILNVFVKIMTLLFKNAVNIISKFASKLKASYVLVEFIMLPSLVNKAVPTKYLQEFLALP